MNKKTKERLLGYKSIKINSKAIFKHYHILKGVLGLTTHTQTRVE